MSEINKGYVILLVAIAAVSAVSAVSAAGWTIYQEIQIKSNPAIGTVYRCIDDRAPNSAIVVRNSNNTLLFKVGCGVGNVNVNGNVYMERLWLKDYHTRENIVLFTHHGQLSVMNETGWLEWAKTHPPPGNPLGHPKDPMMLYP